MGKKQTIAIFKGSLKTHWMRYINNVELQMNPTDFQGMSTGSLIMKTVQSLDSKFVQPGFKYNQQIMENKGYYEPSILKLGFVNGYERTYNIGLSQFRFIRHEIDWINNLVEFERSSNGQDDELEDDA